MSRALRVVALSDTHTFEEGLGELPEGDLFIHAGDLLRGGELEELRGVAPWLRSLPHRHKVIVAGNHDWCFHRHREEALALLGPGIVYLEDSGCEVEGLRLWGSPWQPAYNDWAYNLPRGAALAERWALIPEGTDILITHGPPAGLGDRSGVAGRQGCADLRARVQELGPALHLFGHIHADGGLWREGRTCYLNVTSWECERPPTVLDIDPKTRAVTPIQVPPPGSWG